MKRVFFIITFVIGCICIANSQTKSNISYLSKADFLTKVYNYEKNPSKWIYEGTMPCIIDFYADWCGPCRMVSPIVTEIANEYAGKIVVYKVDTDKERNLSRDLNMSSIPTFLFIPVNGEPQIIRGALSKDSFEKVINQVLLK